MAVEPGPCWPEPDVGCCDVWDKPQATDELKQRATDIAATVLWAATARQYGLCELTVRPCGGDCTGRRRSTYYGRGASVPIFAPHMVGTAWVNTPCDDGDCGTADCGCCSSCSIHLPGPVADVVQVRINGAVVDPATYRVDDYTELVRKSGYACWPRCQNLDADPTEDQTFEVTYRRGLPLDGAALAVFGTYACELLKACLPDCKCRLPKRVQTITREGVTMSFVDPFDFLDAGRTGIPEVDVWIAAVNPYGLRSEPGIYSPDLPPPRVTTWTAT